MDFRVRGLPVSPIEMPTAGGDEATAAGGDNPITLYVNSESTSRASPARANGPYVGGGEGSQEIEPSARQLFAVG